MGIVQYMDHLIHSCCALTLQAAMNEQNQSSERGHSETYDYESR